MARAIDYREFGAWFGVKLENAFVPGQVCRGQITYPGYENLRMELVVQEMKPEHFFSYTWHPHAIEPGVDYSNETPTLVEFHLSESGDGTLLRVIESGFDKLPPARRDLAFRKDEEGWSEQMQNIASYVEQGK